MVRAIPFNSKSPPVKKAKVGTANPKRGISPKKNGPVKSVADSASAARPFLFPPPPPPPPPPVDNPYYQKFVEEYWNKYDGSYSSLPTMPAVPVVNLTIPSQPTAKAVKSKKLRNKKEKHQDRLAVPIPTNLPPISLSQEFPINTDRTTYFIGDPTADLNALSAKSCYIRSRLLELFTTLPTEDTHPKFKGKLDESKAVPIRVGLRCVYCANQPLKSRAERSVCYPSSISRLYGTVADMQHKHLDLCQLIPPRVRATIHHLKSTIPREWLEKNLAPKQYYEISALELGMEDIEGDKAGIRLTENHKLIVKSVESVNELFVPMGEEKMSESPVKKMDEGNLEEEEDSEDADENKIEKADNEVEEILAQL